MSEKQQLQELYAFSFDQENYQGYFDSREEAVAEAFSDDDSSDTVWTGVSVKPDRVISAEDIIDQVACSTTEESGEWSDGYLANVSKEARDELAEKMQAVWDRWEKKHGLEPDWFNIINAKEHKREEETR